MLLKQFQVVWSICLLHIVELPLKHLMRKLDGKESSGERWSGPIGKHLNTVTEMPIKPNFQTIQCDLPDLDSDVLKNMNEDNKYLYKIAKIIVTGIIPPDFELYEVGVLCLARSWLIKCNIFTLRVNQECFC